MKTAKQIKSTLKKFAERTPGAKAKYYKTGKGDYAEHDKFIGVNVPTLRKLAKEVNALPMPELQDLLSSKINEERLIALFILINLYNASDSEIREDLYQFYLNNLRYVNNWNLVDASAHLIMGDYLVQQKESHKSILLTLSRSNNMWERRVAIVATWYFIRKNQFSWTLKIAKILLNDSHDLIHKAVGWMLREVGKKDIKILIGFLELHAHKMPRTMLRYAIEKFPETRRKHYLNYASTAKA